MGKGVGWTVTSSDLGAPQRWKSPLTVRRPAPDVPFPCSVLGREAVVLSWCSV